MVKGWLFKMLCRTLAALLFLFSFNMAFVQLKVSADGISGGDGSPENPFVIISASGLLSIASNPSASYLLGCDIDLSGVSWTPICDASNPFTGVLDGGHHVLKNIRINSSADYVGFISYISYQGVVENLGIDSGTIRASHGNVGSIAAQNHGTIEECYNRATVTSTYASHYIGGIAGANFGTIDNCYNIGSLSCYSSNICGGIAGTNQAGEITNCYSAGSLPAYSNTGGITGSIAGNGDMLTGCHFLANNGMHETADDTMSSTGETQDMLTSRDTYDGWDFNSVWTITSGVNSGYPYFISVSGNNDLSGIDLSDGSLNPIFDPNTTSYSVAVGNDVSQITVTPTPADANATVTVNGNSPATPVPLTGDINAATIAVTAQNNAVKIYALTITKAASGNNDLSGIGLSTGTLSPAFDSNTTSYSVNVDNDVSQITVTPTTADANATVTVNGNSPATPVSLNIGVTVVTITVTAQNGTVKIYTLNITKAASGNCNLSGIGLSAGLLNPAFDPSIRNYTVTVNNSISQITITPTTADANATVTVNGKSLATPISLNVGVNIVTITVTAQNGTGKTYTLNITRVASGNCDLSGIGLSAGSLNPTFDPNTTSYAVNVDNNVSQITVTPVTADANATVTVNGKSPATPVSLNVGVNVITITVTAQSGTGKTYTLNITRAASGNCDLSGISLSAGSFNPSFDPNTTSYSVNVNNSISQIIVTPTTADTNATVTVNGKSPATPVSLNVGVNIVTITVTAQNGTVKVYTLNITRAASGNCNLSGISLSTGSLNPSFVPNTTSYAVNVNNDVSQITVTPVTADANATVTVNGKSPATPISLNVGVNVVTITVTAQNGTGKTYTLNITKSASGNNDLSGISLSAGSLNPTFDPNTTSYSVTVDNDVSQITVTPTTADANATVTVNGKYPATPVPLTDGANAVIITVTAQDGTVKTYTLNITRAASGNCDLSNISLSNGSLNPAFDPNTTSYSVNVNNSISQITVTPTAADANATVTVNGKSPATPIPLNVGINIITITVTAQNKAVEITILSVYRAPTGPSGPSGPPGPTGFGATVQIPNDFGSLSGTDLYDFSLGDVDAGIEVDELRREKAAGNLDISEDMLSQSDIRQIAQFAPAESTITGAFYTGFTSGTDALASYAEIKVRLSADDLALLKYGTPEIYLYDPATHRFTNLGATFGSDGTVSFRTQTLGTFVFALGNAHGIPYQYSVSADSQYTAAGGTLEFSVNVSRDSDSPVSYNGEVMVVTELSGGQQTYAFYQLTGDETLISAAVDSRAVKSSVYLINGTFNGYEMPQMISLAQFVTSR